MGMNIGIVNYGSGNFSSVFNTVSSITDSIKIIHSPSDFNVCSHIILPGVGAFASAMLKLKELNLTDSLNEEILTKKKPFLGICVGFQIIADHGFEFGKTAGLHWLSGNVEKFNFSENIQLRLPHIGWNEVEGFDNQKLFKEINPDEPSFYFVHSYHLNSESQTAKFVYSNYGYRFISAVECDNIFGVQFHPEKSQTNGVQVLKNFIKIND